MNMDINILVVRGDLDGEAGHRRIRDADPMDFVWGFEGTPGGITVIGAEALASPWEAPDLSMLSRCDTGGALESAWEASATAVQEQFRAAVRWSAERWLEAILRVARQEDRWFETSLATWIPLNSGGRLLVAPQNSDGFDSDALYGDLFVEGRNRFASVAAAVGIEFPALEALRIDVL